MTPKELETYLHKNIPLSAAMQVSVVAANGDQVILGAPLAPNINHHATAFGGSVSTLAILSAWTLVHHKLSSAGLKTSLVIQRNQMHYEKPITGSFTAEATLLTADAWPNFLRMLQRKGRARITVKSVLLQDGLPAGHFEGDFVALGGEAFDV